MREIKFRGKRIDNGEWVYGDLMTVKHFVANSEGKYQIGDFNSGVVYDVIPETIEQYTGLHDKNGKEIYGGDIVEITRPCIYEKGIIILKNGCYFAKVKETLLALYEAEINNYKIEVIGNIYDNPELLEVQNEQ